MADCSQWKENFSDCQLWVDNADKEAAARVIEREKERLAARLMPHFANDVWEQREGPPEDWDKRLPEYMEERRKDSLLAKYVQYHDRVDKASSSELAIIKAQVATAQAVNATACTIM